MILYDERGGGKLLAEIDEKPRSNGYPGVRILAGGFAGYEAAGEPTQGASTQQMVPPATRQEVQALDWRL